MGSTSVLITVLISVKKRRFYSCGMRVGMTKEAGWVKQVFKGENGSEKWERVSKTSINEDTTKFIIGVPIRGIGAMKLIMTAVVERETPDIKYQALMEFGEPGDSYCGICTADIDDSDMSVWSANGTLNEDIICAECRSQWTFNPVELIYTRNA